MCYNEGIDSANYTINDKEMTLDVPATIISEHTYKFCQGDGSPDTPPLGGK